jgi:CheY-like chemotaxis protein
VGVELEDDVAWNFMVSRTLPRSRRPSIAHIVVLVIDGELGAELVAVAGAAGHDVDVCASEAEVWNPCEKPADLLISDASSDSVDGVTLADSMLAGGELRGVRTLALYADADPAAKARAQEVAFDLVLPRSRMDAEGAQLVERLLA